MIIINKINLESLSQYNSNLKLFKNQILEKHQDQIINQLIINYLQKIIISLSPQKVKIMK